MTTELAGTIALCLCTRKPPAIADVSAGTGRIVLRLLAPPSVKATLSRRQGVKASFERSRLAAPRPVAPRIASCDQEGPAIAPRYLTAAIVSGAAVVSVDHEQKKFSGILRICVRWSHAVPAPKAQRFNPPSPKNFDLIRSGLFVLISKSCVRRPSDEDIVLGAKIFANAIVLALKTSRVDPR